MPWFKPLNSTKDMNLEIMGALDKLDKANFKLGTENTGKI